MIEKKMMRRLIDLTRAGRIDWQGDEDSFHAWLPSGLKITISMRIDDDYEPDATSWSINITDAHGESVASAFEQDVVGPVKQLHGLVSEFVRRRRDIRSGRSRRREEALRKLKDDLGL